MKPVGIRLLTWMLVSAALFSFALSRAAVPPVVLYIENDVASVWDTDPSKIGVELQLANKGISAADHVRVTSITVQGGALAGLPTFPILLGTVHPQGRTIFDFIMTGSPSKNTPYLVTIKGAYIYAGNSYDFALNRAISPTAAPHSITTHGGVSPKDGASGPPPSAADRPPGGPNATTPMMIPIGPPRQLSLPGPATDR